MRRRRRNEKGAVLVEMVFIVPVLMTIVLGMFEMGLAWRDKVSVSQATRQSVRTVSHLGNDPALAVDREGLLALRASMFDQWDEIEFVVIYRATADGSMESDDCLTGSSVANHCNFYGTAALAALDDDSSPYWSDSHVTVAWDWDSRSSSMAAPDHVGVYVEIKHPWETGYFPGDGLTISDASVMRLEPARG